MQPTPNQYRQTIRQQLAKLPTQDTQKLIELVNKLTQDEDETAQLETLYAYLNGHADWKTDYNTLITSRQTNTKP